MEQISLSDIDALLTEGEKGLLLPEPFDNEYNTIRYRLSLWPGLLLNRLNLAMLERWTPETTPERPF